MKRLKEHVLKTVALESDEGRSVKRTKKLNQFEFLRAIGIREKQLDDLRRMGKTKDFRPTHVRASRSADNVEADRVVRFRSIMSKIVQPAGARSHSIRLPRGSPAKEAGPRSPTHTLPPLRGPPAFTLVVAPCHRRDVRLQPFDRMLEEKITRTMFIAALTATGLAIAAASGASAAPVNSAAIGALTTATDHPTTVQYYRGYGYRGYSRYGYGRRWSVATDQQSW